MIRQVPALLCVVGLLSMPCGFVATSMAADDDQIRAKFKSLDGNGDGKLSLMEYSANKSESEKTKAARRFNELDKDKSGTLSLEEFKAGYKGEEKSNE